MSDKNGGYIIIDLEATKECWDKIIKFIGAKPILLSYNGDILRLDNINVEHGNLTDRIYMFTSKGKVSLFKNNSEGTYEISGYGISYDLTKLSDDIEFGNEAKVVKGYGFTDEDFVELYNKAFNNSLEILGYTISDDYMEDIIVGKTCGTYTYDGATYTGVVLHTTAHALFVGNQWSNFAKPNGLVAVITPTDFTPAEIEG